MPRTCINKNGKDQGQIEEYAKILVAVSRPSKFMVLRSEEVDRMETHPLLVGKQAHFVIQTLQWSFDSDCRHH